MTAAVNSRRMIHQGRVFQVMTENVTLSNGITVDMDLVNHPGASAIVPLAENNHVILLRQYRHAIGGYLWEIPAGTLNQGENPLACARRELAEETGFGAKSWRKLGELIPVPGYSNKRIHLYLACDLEKAKSDPDADEILEVHSVAWEDAMNMILDGRIQDAKTISSLLMADRTRNPADKT